MLKEQRYTDESVSIVGICKENKQGRFMELTFTKKMGRSGLRTLRLPPGRGKEGWANLGLCLLDLFNPGVREGMNMEVKKKQTYPDRPNVNLFAQQNTINQDKGKEKAFNVQARKNQIVDIGGLINKSSITHFEWWKATVLCKSNSKLVDCKWVRRKAEDLVGETTLTTLNEGAAVLATESQEKARILEDKKLIEIGGTKISLTRWTPENFEINKNSADFNSGEAVKVFVRKIRLEDIPRIVAIEKRGYKFSIEIIDNSSEKVNFCSEIASEVGRRKEDGRAISSSGGIGKGLDKVMQVAKILNDSQRRVAPGRVDISEKLKPKLASDMGWTQVLKETIVQDTISEAEAHSQDSPRMKQRSNKGKKISEQRAKFQWFPIFKAIKTAMAQAQGSRKIQSRKNQTTSSSGPRAGVSVKGSTTGESQSIAIENSCEGSGFFNLKTPSQRAATVRGRDIKTGQQWS
ncbi:hypothetical protein FRX31_025738 [Thalictrum thalictroides]|uniref:Uncharacterized protein n=1 Tax=Thalictrum thalictroides TaxID=46969 RepID=A0A7J6VIC4_THATH|nr:hypothetical protein FRX31_025738 [Thalictrum thalictroides]